MRLQLRRRQSILAMLDTCDKTTLALSRYLLASHIPLLLTIVLTYNCNLRCAYCFERSLRDKVRGTLTLAEWFSVLREAREMGALYLTITGGEPLCSSLFIELYTYAHKLGYVIRVKTNGTLINDKHITMFKALPPEQVSVSLYGASEKTYQSFCGKECFDIVVNSIAMLASSNINASLTAVMTSCNEKELARLSEIAEQFALNLSVYRFISPSIDGDSRTVCCEASLKSIAESFEILGDASEYRQRKQRSSLTWNSTFKQCYAGKASCVILPNGNMLPCQMCPHEKSLSVTELGFKNCWLMLRTISKELIDVETPCASCSHKLLCGKCALLYKMAADRECKKKAARLRFLLHNQRSEQQHAKY